MTLLEDAEDNFPGADLDNETDLGLNVGGAIGFKASKFRFEVEIMYRQNDLERVVNLTGPSAGLVRNADGEHIRLNEGHE